MRDELQRILSKFVIRTTRNEARRYIKFTDRIPHTRILIPSHYESSLYNAITDIVKTQYKAGSDTLALMIYQRLASSSTAASKRALYKMKGNGLISEEIYRKLVSTASAIQEDSKLSELQGIIGNSRIKISDIHRVLRHARLYRRAFAKKRTFRDAIQRQDEPGREAENP